MIQSGHTMKKRIVIFDLDGTLAIIDKRRELSTKPNGKIDFDKLHDPFLIKHDKPNMPVVKMAQLFAEDGFVIVIFSGRSDKTKFTTKSWLSNNRVPFHKLVMRPHKTMNFIPDEVLKKQMLDDAPFNKDEILMIVDDRQKVVDMWRDLGFTVFQVAEGNF